jgi:hypothetical protein
MAGPRWRCSRLQESRVSQRRPPVGTGVRSAPVPTDCLSAAGDPLLNARKSKVGATQNHVRGPQALLRFDASALRGGQVPRKKARLLPLLFAASRVLTGK